MSSRNCSWRICRSSSRTSKRDAWSPSARGTFESGRCRCAEPRAARWLNTGMGACNMAGMETQGRAALVWIVWFDRFVARWLFAFIALSAIGLALLAVTTHGWVHVVLSLPGHLLIAVAAGGIALLTRSATRRRGAVICLLGDLAAIVPNLLWVGGHQWRGLLTGVLLLPVLVPATRRALSAEPADAIAGGAQTTPEVVAARGQVASQVPGRQVHGFRKPALVLNPRSGSVQAVTRNHYARDLGLDRGDPAAAIEAFVAGPERRVDVATVGGRLFLNNASIGVYAALVHEPSYRDDRLGAIDGVLEGMLERDALLVRATFCDGSGVAWDQVLVLFVSNNAYPLTELGGRLRLDAGMLEVSALRRTEGQEIGRALENLFSGRYQAGQGWARWTTRSFEVDSPGGKLEVGIDGEPVVLDTPVEFKIHAGALRVLLPPPRPASGRAAKSKSPAPRRRALGIAPTPEGRVEQVAGLVRLGRLLGRVGERQFGPARDEHGRPVARRQRRSDESDSRPGGRP